MKEIILTDTQKRFIIGTLEMLCFCRPRNIVYIKYTFDNYIEIKLDYRIEILFFIGTNHHIKLSSININEDNTIINIEIINMTKFKNI